MSAEAKPLLAGASHGKAGKSTARRAGRCELLDEIPELAGPLEEERLLNAARDCIAQTVEVSAGRWSIAEASPIPDGIGLLVLEGLLIRRVGLDGRFGAELLGRGDLLRPWQREDTGATVPFGGGWSVLSPCRMAMLDRAFTVRLAPYPEVTSALFSRAVGRAHNLAVSMAIVHQPRVDVRLHMLLWLLADRWGTVHADGVHLPLRLTHVVLGELIAARRPSVTRALSELAARDAVHWTGKTWLLGGDPPSELEQVAAVPSPEQAS